MESLLAQNEYLVVWGLVIGLCFLGYLAIGIPRLRRTELAPPAPKRKKIKKKTNS